MFFDSHCHLTSENLASDLAAVLQRACDAGVTQMLNIGDSVLSSRAAIEQSATAQEHGVEVWATVGVHPQNVSEYSFETTTAELSTLSQHRCVRAIGEIGLDFVYDETHPQYPGATREVQDRVLRAQLDLAVKLNLPVVLHNREADDALLKVMSEYSGRLEGVFHCFGSPREVAHRVLEMGFHLGFTGLVTFKNAQEVREVAKLCPLERLLIETDAPYLAPVPHRGRTNEPSFLPHIAQTVAQLHQIGVEELAEITTRNARRLFGLED